MKSFLFGALCFGLLMVSCTKSDVHYSKIEMLEMAKKIDSDVDVILPKDINSGIKCTSEDGQRNYAQGCLGAFQVKVGDLDFVAVEFEKSNQAQNEANRLNQFWAGNWLLDDVKGEPGLEDFVKKAFKAQTTEDLSAGK